ncbi:hypothetical protein [uncultured Nitratireductor sp.]|uniref:hypothetical protein n=1 Tax=uncultured Nitratireductor sp. TaxID=520953 RepID=UPI0025EE34F4|nr:hypothetical protein [uncultured Nitratireductor sp.]
MIPLPIDATAWTVLFAVGVALAALGTEYRDRPVFDTPDHWTNDAAFAVMCCGRAVVFLAVALVVGGQVA